jgi:peptidyl-lysine (3S)-dioxygenase / protease
MENSMKKHSEDTKDFWIQNPLPTLHNPSPLEFMKGAMLSYHPVKIVGSIDHWNALTKWNWEYLKEKCQQQTYAVNITPNGLGDCVCLNERDDRLEVQMTMKLFLQMLLHENDNEQEEKEDEDEDAIPYLSQQNNNLINSFPELLDDIECSLPLGDNVFGSLPEAVNLWIGDERSISSLHKDHFENLYVVITGEKIFTLYPPTDIQFFGETIYPTKRYQYSKQHQGHPNEHEHHENNNPINIRIKKSDLISTTDGCPSATLPWIGIDPLSPKALEQLPSLRYTSPIHVTVHAGEVLYIPAMWYHRVTQSCPTIAINYWYEQVFDYRYVMYQMSRRLAPTIQQQEQQQGREEQEEEFEKNGEREICWT